MTEMDMSLYTDYDLQTSVDTKNAVKLQIVGIRGTGQKDILKEFSDEVSFAGFSPKTDFRAPQKKPVNNLGLKFAGAFLLGLVVGGTVVFFAMKSKYEKELAKIAPPPQEYAAPIPQHDYQGVHPDNDMALFMRDYDDDIFARD